MTPDPNSEALFAVVAGQRSQCSLGRAVTQQEQRHKTPPHQTDVARGRDAQQRADLKHTEFMGMLSMAPTGV